MGMHRKNYELCIINHRWSSQSDITYCERVFIIKCEIVSSEDFSFVIKKEIVSQRKEQIKIYKNILQRQTDVCLNLIIIFRSEQIVDDAFTFIEVVMMIFFIAEVAAIFVVIAVVMIELMNADWFIRVMMMRYYCMKEYYHAG